MEPACGSQGPAISTPVRLSADWLYAGTGEPIPFGALLSDSHGRILAAGPAANVPTNPLFKSQHFAGAVLMPGLVNAHTHLELTGLEGQAGESDFAQWIRTIIRLKSAWGRPDFLEASRQGLRDCFARGITTVADTGDSAAPFEALLEMKGSGIAYIEVFGPDPAQAEGSFAAFRERILPLKARQTSRVRLGVSPHAPYSVSGELYRKVAEFARAAELPLAVHIAESAAEGELLGHARGSFAEQWKARNIPLPSLPGRSPVAWLEEQGILGPRTLCIHAVRASGEDIVRMRRRGAAVAHCPRSNRRHCHGDAPLADFLRKGLRVGVGTDSVASVSPLDLLAEARVAAEIASLEPARALDLVMLGAARALDMDEEIGSLEAGKWADCVVVEVDPGGADRVAGAILNARPEDVVATYLAGSPVYLRT